MKIYFLRHAETKLDFDTPVSDWVLSERGHGQARTVADSGIFDSVVRIISSAEQKAKNTAQYVCERLGVELESTDQLNELYRGKEAYMTQDQYRMAVKNLFETGQVLDWESLDSVICRVSSYVDSLYANSNLDDILIVAHGINLTAYFAQLQNVLDRAFERWMQLDFCDYGIVEDNFVVHDIIV
ncbi:MAG: hypothetical protein BAJATHORv1_30274 [Candidatus Thorarchaeota archaeon]|nr:MAG: hypothetical protein BAJATHORv1_30274 [Candidatus Thorarchaeota archaeon]